MRHTKNFATWMFNLLAGLHNKTNRCYIMGRRLTTSLEPQKWPREWLLLTSKGLLRISGGLVQFQMIQPKIWVLDHVLPYKSNLKFFNTRLQNLEVNFKIVDAIPGWMEQLFRWKLHIWHKVIVVMQAKGYKTCITLWVPPLRFLMFKARVVVVKNYIHGIVFPLFHHRLYRRPFTIGWYEAFEP